VSHCSVSITIIQNYHFSNITKSFLKKKTSDSKISRIIKKDCFSKHE